MPMPRRFGWVLAVVAALVLAGCGQSGLVSRQADATYARLEAADTGAAAPAVRARVPEGSAAPAEAAAPVLYFSPRDETAEPTPTASAEAPAAEGAAAEGAGEAEGAVEPGEGQSSDEQQGARVDRASGGCAVAGGSFPGAGGVLALLLGLALVARRGR